MTSEVTYIEKFVIGKEDKRSLNLYENYVGKVILLVGASGAGEHKFTVLSFRNIQSPF